MSGGGDNKTRLLAVYSLLDEPQSLKTLKDKLERRFGIQAKRQTIRDDIAAIESFEPLIVTRKGNTIFYQKGKI